MRDGKTYLPVADSFVGECKAADGSTLDYFDYLPEHGGTIHYERKGVEYTLAANGDVEINNATRQKDIDFRTASGALVTEGIFRVGADGACHKLIKTGALDSDVEESIEDLRQTRKQVEKLPKDNQ